MEDRKSVKSSQSNGNTNANTNDLESQSNASKPGSDGFSLGTQMSSKNVKKGSIELKSSGQLSVNNLGDSSMVASNRISAVVATPPIIAHTTTANRNSLPVVSVPIAHLKANR